ncbi:CLUMA_CG016052, isoform A [Clunio marinus]|uniref:CLUMA_CG016052, isoform A n=1 Tax=Clunio marinus TaxID=568069 RepID=A0A1J1IWC0_9DIPT|nr:CLUMA_CG016052, isoform A [Clunio marinus]
MLLGNGFKLSNLEVPYKVESLVTSIGNRCLVGDLKIHLVDATFRLMKMKILASSALFGILLSIKRVIERKCFRIKKEFENEMNFLQLRELNSPSKLFITKTVILVLKSQNLIN